MAKKLITLTGLQHFMSWIDTALIMVQNDYKGIIEGLVATVSGKQDAISDLTTIRRGAAAGATASQPGHTHSEYAATSHNHDDRYYTESEVDNALAQKAAASHTHTPASIGAAAASHNHNGTYYTETEVDALLAQKASTSALNSKVDAVSGKGLSTNDFTTTDKTKLDSIDLSTSFSGFDSQDIKGKKLIFGMKSVNLNSKVNGTGLTLWVGTQAQYDAISTKSSATVYVITA